MPMVPANYSAQMQLPLVSAGFLGENLMALTDAFGNGTIGPPLVGAPFTTQDTGLTPGIGTGIGTGIMGVVDATISNTMLLGMVAAFGTQGENLPDITDAAAGAFVMELQLASLTSNHTPVFQGAGIVTPGSIVADGSLIGQAILAQGLSGGFLGQSWPDVADVAGTEQMNGLLTATGNVMISGVFTGPTPPGPIPLVGVGSGTIS